MMPTRCETIRPFRPWSAKPILWPISPRSRVWRIAPTGKASDGLASFVLSGLSSIVTTSEKRPKKFYWTQTPPTIRATASKCSPFFMANMASTCIIRCISSKPKPVVCSRRDFAPAMPRLQRPSPLSLNAWCRSLDGVLLRARSLPRRCRLGHSRNLCPLGIAPSSLCHRYRHPRGVSTKNRALAEAGQTQISPQPPNGQSFL